MEHTFTARIRAILAEDFPDVAEFLFENSLLLQYINRKTRSASRGSKSRSSFANLYAIYVLVEDYLTHGFDESGAYENYEGAQFSMLLARIREMPFGAKIQNHALNNRVNTEFETFFPTSDYTPIIRSDNRYWFSEALLQVNMESGTRNIARSVIRIIDEYIEAKREAFDVFIDKCCNLQSLDTGDNQQVIDFIRSLLAPNTDARLFEIVSYGILKNYYQDQEVYFGFDINELSKEQLKLYKTGRTNANDGGIDFVMRPLGRFFQVTETLDVRKYFLDIEKTERFPITFVIKSSDTVDAIREGLALRAKKHYTASAVVDRLMSSIEEIINIPALVEIFESAVEKGDLESILGEIVIQSKIEFNYPGEEDENEIEDAGAVVGGLATIE
ncbi:MAG: restriction endonuclease [Armatimonadetes bacterium]|nr:restriction endonuclease [Armatimonadota bacterium]